MNPHRTIVAVLFVLSLFTGYIIMGFTRHHLYEVSRQEHISECITRLEEEIENKINLKGFPDLNNPEAALVVADPVFEDEVYSLYEDVNEYYCEYQTDALSLLPKESNFHKWNLWDAYKESTVLKYQLLVLYMASGNVYIQMGPRYSDDLCGSLAESVALWEAAGGEREGSWMEVYKQSSEYEAWLNQVFAEVAGPKESGLYEAKNLKDRYTEGIQPLKLPFCADLFCGEILRAEQRLIEMAYERYSTHETEKDVVRTSIDAWIIEYRGVLLASAAERDFDTLYILRSREFPFKDLAIDTCIIIGFSALLTFLVSRKVLPRLESQ